MQDIRNILSLAAEKAESGDLQAAISYYETSFSESQKAQYVGGMFCASKRLGDIYYLLVGYDVGAHGVGLYRAFNELVQIYECARRFGIYKRAAHPRESPFRVAADSEYGKARRTMEG